METRYVTKIGKHLYCDLLSKMNRSEILMNFVEQVRISRNGNPCKNDSYERILLELMVISEKEKIAFSQETIAPIMDVWKDVFARIPLDYRFSGAKQLSADELDHLGEFVKILEDPDFQKSEFTKFFNIEISMASYRMVRSDIPVALGKSYLPTAGKRVWLGKLLPRGMSLAK